MKAVDRNGLCLMFAHEELKGDKELVYIAIKSKGSALEFASDKLKKDEFICIEAVKNGEKAFLMVA
jgi:hypothetical protein